MGRSSSSVLALFLCFGTVAGCSGSPAGASAQNLTFCDVQPILVSKCQRCHQDPPQNGAPFPLLTYADTQVASPTTNNPTAKRFQEMERVVSMGLMPDQSLTLDPPVSALTCQEKATLLGWLRNGAVAAPVGADDCAGLTPTLMSCD